MTYRVLVVDDSRFVCEALGLALRKAGFDVQVARDLSDLERDPGSAAPDLVLMDVVLQEAYGDELAGLLRAMRGLTCPILLMSSLPDDELAVRTADAELDGYVSKRHGIAPIVARVRDLARSHDTGSIEQPTSFPLAARQRVRQVLTINSVRDHWNAAAILGEMRALVGDAQLAGASEIAALAQLCHDLVRTNGADGGNAEIGAAIDALARAIGEPTAARRKLLIIDDTGMCNTELLGALDGAGLTVVEARTMAEARQKLHATEYDLIVVDVRLAGVEDVRTQARGARLLAVAPDGQPPGIADRVVAVGTPIPMIVSEIEGLLDRR